MERKCITGSQHAAPTAAAAGAGIGRQRAGGLPGLPRVLCPEPDLELQRHRQRGPRQDRRRLQVVRQQGDKGGHSISRAKVARFWPFSHGGDKKKPTLFLSITCDQQCTGIPVGNHQNPMPSPMSLRSLSLYYIPYMGRTWSLFLHRPPPL